MTQTVGGYILVDCTGIDENETGEQTVPGIFSKISAAFNSGKEMRAINLVDDSKPIAPVSMVCVKDSETQFTVGFTAVGATITSADKVKVVSSI